MNQQELVTVLLDAIITFLGVYLVVMDFKMKKSGVINKTLMAPEEIKKIKKPTDYIAYIYTKILVFAVACFIAGILGLVSDLIITIPYYGIVEMVIFLVAIIVLNHYLRVAREKFL